ncbi:MAG: sigma-54-dependent transcriptional regulator [Limisphaerales bacterium]
MPANLLLIEDDPGAGPALQRVLASEGYSVRLVTRGDEGLACAAAGDFDLILTDFRLPGLSGLELIGKLHAVKPKLPIIMMTAHGTTDTAIEATKLGACEYVTKPCDAEELLALVEAAVAHSCRMSEPVLVGGETYQPGSAILGRSRVMQTIYKEIGRVANTPVTVLIRGATGTGKELVARAIYQHSDRSGKPFIAVNCATVPVTLIESELFGHERGAFTGAANRRIGRFEQAHGGTLFLDEIGDLPWDAQAKLLRALQEKCIQRLGGDDLIPIDLRILAATHRDLEAAIAEREFREDLFFRISVVTLQLPTLAERAEDIPELVRHFLVRYAAEFGIEGPSIDPEALEFLQLQSWPGNVRELENAVRQALLMAKPFAIGVQHVRQVLTRAADAPPPANQTHAAYISALLQRAARDVETSAYWRMIADLEPELFAQAIRLAEGNQSKAARWLGITRLKLREKLAELGLQAGRPPR